MSGSQIPAVKSWMVTNYQNAANANPVSGRSLQVFKGAQDLTSSSDLLVVGDASRTVEPFTMRGGFSGPGSLREIVSQELVLTAYGQGGEEVGAVIGRAYQWLSLIEQTTASDFTLGGLVDIAWLAESADSTWQSDQGWVAEITCRVQFKAEN